MRTFCIFLIVMFSAIPLSGKAEPPTDKAPCSGTEYGSNPPTIVVDSVLPESPLVGEGVSLLLIAEDPDGQSIITRSEFVEAPAFSEAKLTPPVGSTPAFYPDVEGTYVIRSTVTDERGCSSFAEVEVTAGIGETDCQPGEYVYGDQCSACPAGTFSDTTNATSCTEWADCVPGEYVESGGTATSDRSCSTCPDGYTSYANNASSCELIDSCTDGDTRECTQSNVFGTCTGTQVCDLGSWGPCSATEPAEDICDGLDNDCDGFVDELFTNGTVTYISPSFPGDDGKSLGDSCGTGACTDGSVICNTDGDSLLCTTQYLASTETCDDQIDNDCDGLVDEGCTTGCASDDDCAAGHYCDATNSCVIKKNNGDSCSDTNQCTSGFCVDGYCCDSSCGGSCDSCNVSGSLGSCTVNLAGSQGSPSCGAYLCTGSASSCPTSCAVDGDCSAGHFCDDGNLCVPKLSAGSSCNFDSQCISGVCENSICGG